MRCTLPDAEGSSGEERRITYYDYSEHAFFLLQRLTLILNQSQSQIIVLVERRPPGVVINTVGHSMQVWT